jgi:hypothetical protein
VCSRNERDRETILTTRVRRVKIRKEKKKKRKEKKRKEKKKKLKGNRIPGVHRPVVSLPSLEFIVVQPTMNHVQTLAGDTFPYP